MVLDRGLHDFVSGYFVSVTSSFMCGAEISACVPENHSTFARHTSTKLQIYNVYVFFM